MPYRPPRRPQVRALLAGVLLTTVPAAASAAAQLDVTYGSPAYALAAACNLTQPLAFLNVVVHNAGDAAATAQTFDATDDLGVLAGSMTLAPLNPGATASARIPLSHVAASTKAVGGAHVISVAVGTRRLTPVSLQIPAAFCASPIAAPLQPVTKPVLSSRAASATAARGPALSGPDLQTKLAQGRTALAALKAPPPKSMVPVAIQQAANAGFARAHASNVSKLNGRLPSTFSFEELRAFIGFAHVDVTRPIPSTMIYALVVSSPDATLPENDNVRYSTEVPDCNLKFSISGGVLRNPRTDTGIGFVPVASRGYPYVGGFTVNGWDISGSFRIGVKPHRLVLRYVLDSPVPLTTSFMVQSDEDFQRSFIASIDENGAIANDGGLGMTAANIGYRVPGLRRVNQGDVPMYGTDIVGKGIALGPGVKATAAIVAARSVLDLDDKATPDNVYRGATVSLQPDSGRLETHVDWHLQPHESLQYAIQWTFTGRPGQRPVLSMPLAGPCDS